MTKEELLKKYPVGSRVRLLKMDDIQAPPIGTLGTVKGVDDKESGYDDSQERRELEKVADELFG